MPEQQLEPGIMSGKDLKSLETSLQSLWEKARSVSEILLHLREANAKLRERVGELERREREIGQTLRAREEELERVRNEVMRLQSNGSDNFSKEEKEALKVRIKDLISKISARL